MARLVFIPGMMCDQRLFQPQIDALAGRIDMVCADLEGPPGITGLAGRILDAHDGDLFVAGLSMGGIVAMEMARLAPGRIERLALLDTNHHADLPERRPVRARQIADARSGHLAQVIIEDMKPNYLAETSRKDQALLDLVVDMALRLGPDVFERQSIALRDRADQTGTLRSFTGEALVLCGAEDRLCPPERHAEMARLLRHSELVIIKGAGHLSTLEQPEQVTAALSRWLDRAGRAEASA